MENKKQVGGKRRGAGRKPILSKKKQVSLYVEGAKIIKFGNEEKMKESLYEFIDGFGNKKIVYTQPTPESFDGKRVDKFTHDEPSQWAEPKPVTFKTVAQWVKEKRELESEEEFNKWEAELDADTILTEKQKNLIKIS